MSLCLPWSVRVSLSPDPSYKDMERAFTEIGDQHVNCSNREMTQRERAEDTVSAKRSAKEIVCRNTMVCLAILSLERQRRADNKQGFPRKRHPYSTASCTLSIQSLTNLYYRRYSKSYLGETAFPPVKRQYSSATFVFLVTATFLTKTFDCFLDAGAVGVFPTRYHSVACSMASDLRQ